MISKIKALIFKNKDEKLDKFSIFMGLVDTYLRREHPKISFDFSIASELKDEPNLKVKKSLFILDIVRQFVEFYYEKSTQPSVNKDRLWSGYGANSHPSLKQPLDFLRRKELIFLRDKSCCNRCGKELEDIKDSFTVFAQDIKDGGGYNVENLILVCFNCYQVLNNKDKKFSDIPLKLKENLYDLV